jgi:long-chain fatty acid transport protein
LGADNGPGFGWKNVTAIKLGASYAYNNALTVRAGYNHSSQPIRSNETMFNILAPGVVQDHLTFGTTWTLSNQAELSLAYMHAFKNSVKGSDSLVGYSTGEVNLNMHQDSLGIAYGWKL